MEYNKITRGPWALWLVREHSQKKVISGSSTSFMAYCIIMTFATNSRQQGPTTNMPPITTNKVWSEKLTWAFWLGELKSNISMAIIIVVMKEGIQVMIIKHKEM